jgi:hypothetical protein
VSLADISGVRAAVWVRRLGSVLRFGAVVRRLGSVLTRRYDFRVTELSGFLNLHCLRLVWRTAWDEVLYAVADVVRAFADQLGEGFAAVW